MDFGDVEIHSFKIPELFRILRFYLLGLRDVGSKINRRNKSFTRFISNALFGFVPLMVGQF